MTLKAIFSDYKDRKLSIEELKQKLAERRRETVRIPLSAAQQGLWVLQKTFPRMSAYNVPLCFRLPAQTDAGLLKLACQSLLQQYPILTSVIRSDGAVRQGPYRITRPHVPLAFTQVDGAACAEADMLGQIRQIAKEPFDLEAGPLMRVHLFCVGGQARFVLFTLHHLIFDAASVPVFVNALAAAYESLRAGKTPVCASCATPFRDFVEQEAHLLAGKEGERRLQYWKTQLAGSLPRLDLPVDNPRPEAEPFDGATFTCAVPPAAGDAVKRFSKTHSIYFSALFLGVFKGLLYGYSGQSDMLVGMPVNERAEARFSRSIGFFINMVAVRSHCAPDDSFLCFLKTLQSKLINAIAHSYPLPALVRELKIPAAADSPVFQVAFAYQDLAADAELDSALPLTFVEGIQQEGEYELVLEVMASEKGFVLNFKYNPSLYAPAFIARMAGHYLRLLRQVIDAPDRRLSEYTLLSPGEEQQLLRDWNATSERYPEEVCMPALFERRVRENPQAVAAVFEDQVLTYAQLDQRSTALAQFLQARGIMPDTLVAVCVERSLEMLVALLGILKAGGAYVPLDPEYPAGRLAAMLADSGAAIILTKTRQAGKVHELMRLAADGEDAGVPPIVIDLDREWEVIADAAARLEPLQALAGSDHLAYVIYTSGSTGKPKGVMIAHRALTNFLLSMSKKPGLQAGDKLLAVTTYCFDIAGLELFLPLIVGAQCHICADDKVKDIEKLQKEIARSQPTVMQATPSTWTMLFHNGWRNAQNLKILCGGEPLPDALRRFFTDTGSQAWNLYGPTETTIWSSVQRIAAEGPITIGKPIANTQMHIIDPHQRLTPVGVPGELCIAGHGLARGYWRRPDLTAEKFIDHPFCADPGKGEKLYRTGDLARRRPDGGIEHLGRIDQLVKLRGYRIELGDIESHLNRHPGVRECVVVAKGQGDARHLVASYVPADTAEMPEGPALRRYLQDRLPAYMLPSFFVALDRLPRTPNGKIDRNELLRRETAPESRAPQALPPSQVEAAVLALWQEMLGTENIGIRDGFLEAGGNSVLAVLLAERISKTFACEFKATHLFKYPTVQAVSRYLAAQAKSAGLSTGLGNAAASSLPPSSSQQRPQSRPPEASADAYPAYYQDSLALIGISCHFPGAADHAQFWRNLREGRESATRFSAAELRRAHVPEALIRHPDYVPRQFILSGTEDGGARHDLKYCFDPGFFNIPPSNARLMDPQFRMLLQHAWKAVEDAGYVPQEIPDTCVFMSCGNHFYPAPLFAAAPAPEDAQPYAAWVLAQEGSVATTISYQLGLKGPSFAVHANCSSSLIGLHAAWQHLQLHEARYALVGAASLLPSACAGYLHQAGMNFSSDGHCRAFDAAADGMVGGEGVAVIVLKRAMDAVRDGDHIYALIRGIGVNNDGHDKAGFYAPSVAGQAEVIDKVLDRTGIQPEMIRYVEAHGTATRLGDPIEVAALSEVYRRYTQKKQYCGIGSVKTNIGHLDTAAGLAGCIKVALSLQHGEIPPSLTTATPIRRSISSLRPFTWSTDWNRGMRRLFRGGRR